ncbi:hypothetical protein [Jannaschia sp. R86511]|uniref:hypothetical protein n=1 Tax=Jannaschia sp. R86511 TaxID=3093853 RepID=UPI0036D3A951
MLPLLPTTAPEAVGLLPAGPVPVATGIVLAVVAAVLVTVGTGVQARTAGRGAWWAGTAVLGAGSVVGAAALVLAPVSVVQPLGVLALPLAIGWAARRARTPVGASRVLAAACCVLGVAGLVVLLLPGAAPAAAGPGPTGEQVATWGAVALVAAATVGALGSVLASVGARVVLLSAATGVAFGAVAVMTRLTLLPLLDGRPPPATGAVLLALLLGLGLWALHRARDAGRHALLVATLTLVDPLVAVLLGTTLLDEQLPDGAAGSAAAAAAALAALGVVLLARSGADPGVATPPPARTVPPGAPPHRAADRGRGVRRAPHVSTEGALA